jgi:rhodanese-related sulfurtransferase
MAQAVRLVIMLALLAALSACGGKVRHDFGGGGSDAQVMILRDPPAVELSIWEGAVVYDLREYDEWSQGHITGARRVTVEDLEEGRALPEDLEAPVLFMGEGPLDSRPEQAADIALKHGHSNVQVFPGGWRQWIGAHPVQD